jgi:hypothetical protein
MFTPFVSSASGPATQIGTPWALWLEESLEAHCGSAQLNSESYSYMLARDCIDGYCGRSSSASDLVAKTRRVMKRKNMLMDQRKLSAAKAALGAETETAAVDAALDLVVFRTEVFRGLDEFAAAGGVASVEPVRRAG